jgi:hypothetical protein
VAEDYNIAKWWPVPEGVRKLKELGF